LRIFDKSKIYDFLHDDFEGNADIWNQMKIELKMSLLEKVDSLMIASGLSGAGKTYTLFNEANGIVFETLKEIYTPDIKVRVCEMNMATGQVHDLSLGHRPVSKNYAWSGIEEIPKTSNLDDLIIALVAALRRRATEKTEIHGK
jgi:phage head maturation protease